MQKFKVGFIGTGGRSVCYASAYEKSDEIEITGLADPSVENRRAMAQKANLSKGYVEYDDWREMLKQQKLDGVVISSPNNCHAEQAIACLELGIAIALEKPLATTPSDCQRILDAEKKHDGRVLIGFVLRSTPFYTKIRELILSGIIGKLTSIQADELPGWGVSSIMNRSKWRRYTKDSGGSMLEKSCHDMDILNWLIDSRPMALNSFGGRQIFTANPNFPDKCSLCPINQSCQYSYKPVFSGHEDEGEEIMHEFIRDEDCCIYNVDKDVSDVQSLNLFYANGVIANFMLNFHVSGPKAGRNFHAIGTKGRIWGCHHEHELFCYQNDGEKLQKFDTSGDGSGHGGGDRLHALELLKMMKDRNYRPDQNSYAGYLSAAMCFAADISMNEGKRINFRYDESGIVKID